MGVTALIRGSFLGYVWRAMRDDEDASRALGVKTFLQQGPGCLHIRSMGGHRGRSSGLGPGGGLSRIDHGMGISIDVLIGPIVGGLGTAFGPLIGALIIIPLDHLMSSLGATIGVPGVKQRGLRYGAHRCRLAAAGRCMAATGIRRFRSPKAVRSLRPQVVQTQEVGQ